MITTLKWGGGLLVLVVLVFTVLALTGRKTFHTEVFIPVSPGTVWQVLMETDTYPAWNPVFIEIDGQYRLGANVINKVQTPDGVLTINAKVTEFVPEQKLRQQGGLPGFLTFDHFWELVPEDGGTRLIQHEIDKGAYLWFWDSSWVQPAYEQASLAVRDHALSVSSSTDR